MIRLRRIAAVLLVVTAGVFVIGVSVEKSDTHDETSAESVGHDETGEAEGEAGQVEEEPAEGKASQDEATEEKVLGVNLESPALVGTAVVVSVALAAGLWFTGLTWAAVVAALLALGFAVFDVAEVVHQLDESRSGLAVLAGVVAAGHIAAAATAARSALRR